MKRWYNSTCVTRRSRDVVPSTMLQIGRAQEVVQQHTPQVAARGGGKRRAMSLAMVWVPIGKRCSRDGSLVDVGPHGLSHLDTKIIRGGSGQKLGARRQRRRKKRRRTLLGTGVGHTPGLGDDVMPEVTMYPTANEERRAGSMAGGASM